MKTTTFYNTHPEAIKMELFSPALAINPAFDAGTKFTTPLARGNRAMRLGQYTEAIALYVEAIQQTPALGKIIAANMALAKKKHCVTRSGLEKPHVAVCGWELAHNAAGRVYTLAMLYETFAEVEIIGSLFPQWGREVWEPIRHTPIPKHSFIVEDESRFLAQAIRLVAAHPYDVVHLSKPRAPNIFFGILYKLIWNAKVMMDIDDEELALVGEALPISIDDYIKKHGNMPGLKNLAGKDWTRLAVGLAQEFDSVTVCNPALQQRYGGEIISYARDEKLYNPSTEFKRNSREKFGIPLDKNVVLFFGTPQLVSGMEPPPVLKSLLQYASIGANQGVSIIILTLNGAALLKRLLSSFFSFNSYNPIELIIIDHGSTDETGAVAEMFKRRSLVQYINRGHNYSFAASCNFGTLRANYPHLLFLNNDINFTFDVLPEAIQELGHTSIGAVGVRLDDVTGDNSKDCVNHYGIQFTWNEKRGYFMPEQQRHSGKIEFQEMIKTQCLSNVLQSRGNYHNPLAVTGAFLLCRKSDFERVGGFDEEYDYGLEDIDFCLKLRQKLGQLCHCINHNGLQHTEGSTRKKLVTQKRLDRNHEIFKGKWAQYIREIIYEPAGEDYKERTLPQIAIPAVAPGQLRVSIIIAVYGKLKYTLRCLKSIAENTPPCYEIVLIDDCSQDESGNYLPKIANITYRRNHENIGFLLSCNRGINLSRGGDVLFLNNDTEVMPGWLDSLLLVLEQPEAGAVGSKLIYPDGSLQEAGCIYWQDALGVNYGRKDRNPNRPEYNFLREVDKCSGASLLVRREIIEKTGGFDTRFAPAYKEDADLCFEVRRLGYKVMYQPMSVVIHYEGISCGTDANTSIKKYQTLNQPKFIEKWHDVLKSQHMENRRKNIFLARSRPLQARYILIIDDKLPEYDRHAGGLGMYQYTLLLMEMGFKVIYYPDNKKRAEPYATELTQLGIEIMYETSTAAFNTWIEMFGKYLAFVWLSRPTESVKYIDMISKHSHARLLYCGRDLHYLRHYRRYEIENDPTYLKSSNVFKEKEFKLFSKTDVIMLFSDVEADLLKKEGVDSSKIRIIPAYYYEARKTPLLDAERRDLVFVGGFKHQPNVDAILWFVNNCFPILEKRFSDIRLKVVGPDPIDSILALARENIEIMGYVENLEEIYAKSRVTIAPIRYGAGVKGKIVNSMSFGIPVVTTNIGKEGMGLSHGCNCLVANNPTDFANEVARLLMDDDDWRRLSSGALAYVAEKYSKNAARKCMTEILS